MCALRLLPHRSPKPIRWPCWRSACCSSCSNPADTSVAGSVEGRLAPLAPCRGRRKLAGRRILDALVPAPPAELSLDQDRSQHANTQSPMKIGRPLPYQSTHEALQASSRADSAGCAAGPAWGTRGRAGTGTARKRIHASASAPTCRSSAWMRPADRSRSQPDTPSGAGSRRRHAAGSIDLGLPGIDGMELVRRVLALPACAHVRLIALTGYGADESRQRAREACSSLGSPSACACSTWSRRPGRRSR